MCFNRLQSGEENRHLFYEYSTAIDIKSAALVLPAVALSSRQRLPTDLLQTKTYSIEPTSGASNNRWQTIGSVKQQLAITHLPTSSDDVEALNASERPPEQPLVRHLPELS